MAKRAAAPLTHECQWHRLYVTARDQHTTLLLDRNALREALNEVFFLLCNQRTDFLPGASDIKREAMTRIQVALGELTEGETHA